jgi:hypothetical protein
MMISAVLSDLCRCDVLTFSIKGDLADAGRYARRLLEVISQGCSRWFSKTPLSNNRIIGEYI